ncbi:alpha/beta hydrolase [Bailinhaonella thermotolerans]|uniref:Alpha/beta hydrolase n=1 Tax=Bailinhaonella thermotolerans TaxID=1070861 RepID=A0A3A4B9T7_9ACTN|nr:alpha/beta hydrolase [Bailinhaonella thermotolerans]RJL35323.1 alpha/beta hydrolase [Bailinhaonella thermotolerans]
MSEYLRFFPELPPARGRHTEEWWSWRGMEIHIERVTAPEASAKLIALHGAGGYGGMLLPYTHLIGATDAVEVVAPDLPGYGTTRLNGQRVGYDDWVDCAADLIVKERDGRPIFLIGASMGGLLAYSAAARSGADGLIVTCLLDIRRPRVRTATARLPLLGRLPFQLLRPLDGLHLPIRWVARMSAMSNTPELNRVVAADRRGGGNHVSLRFLRTFMTSRPEVEPEDFTACPVLMVHPGADRWTPIELSLPFYERLSVPKRLVRLENAGHMPIEQPGLTQMVTAIQEFVANVTERVTS